MHGFAPDEDAAVVRPEIPIEDSTRERMMRVLAAQLRGATPEEVSGYLKDGFPGEVAEQLADELERVELSDHVDVLVAAMQSGAMRAAA